MPRRKTYHTDGRELILQFLSRQTDRPCTIDEIYRSLPPAQAPGKSTLYRIMTELVESGTVRRFVRGNSRQFTYQLLGGGECDSHLHLKCVDCGRVVHFSHEVSEFVESCLLKQYHFTADESATLLLGRCETCAGKGQNHA